MSDAKERLARALGVDPDRYTLDDLVDFVEIDKEGDVYAGCMGICGLSVEGMELARLALCLPEGVANGW